MKAYKVTLVYNVFAQSEADAQIQALQSPCLNITELGCEEIQVDYELEKDNPELPDIPF